MNRFRRCAIAAFAAILTPNAAWALPIAGSINVKPYSVGPTFPVTPDPQIAQDFSYASAIYDQVGISVNNLGAGTIVQADGNNDGNWTAAEFHATLNNIGRVGLPAGTIVTYYVPSYPAALAQTFSDEDVQGAVLNPGIIVNNARNPDTQAHELGHMLVNDWRWKSTEDGGSSGIHSGQANDLMAPGTSRNIPTALNQVWPSGTTDQIRNTVGYLNGNATAIIPAISAMYTRNSEVTITARDTFSVGLGIVDGFGGGPTVGSGPINWADHGTVTDPLRGISFGIEESARRAAPAGQEEFAFYYHASKVMGPMTLLQLAVAGVDSIDTGYASIVPGSVSIDVYSNILNDAGKAVLNPGPDYSFAGIIAPDHSLANFGVTINGGVLTGMQDIAVHFDLQVIPEPASWLLFAAGASVIAIARFRKRKMQAHCASP